jgi:hypothetical protein
VSVGWYPNGSAAGLETDGEAFVHVETCLQPGEPISKQTATTVPPNARVNREDLKLLIMV